MQLHTFQKLHMYTAYIQRMWTGNGMCHVLSNFKSRPSQGSCSYLLRDWKAECRWQSLQCSSNTYKSEEVNHSDTLWGHREVIFQASIPRACNVERHSFPVVKCCTFPAAARERACEDIRCVWMHFMLCIMLVLHLLDCSARCKTQYKNEATCVSFGAHMEGAEGFQDVCIVEENQLWGSGVRRGSGQSNP